MATTDQATNAPSYLDIQDPYGAIQAAQIARQQMLSQALLQQGMEGMPGTQMAGNVAIRNSPFQGLSRMLQSYTGVKGLQDAATQAGQLQASRLQQLNDQNQNFANNPPSGGVNPFAGMTPAQITAWQLQNPGKYQEALAASNLQQNKPTEQTLSGRQAGMPPEIVQAVNARQLDKSLSNFHVDREGRMWDLTKGSLVGVAPSLPQGATYGPNGPDGFPTSMVPFPGGPQAQQSAAFANASGAAGGGIGQYTLNGRENVPMYGVQAAGGLPRLPNWTGGPPSPQAPNPAIPGAPPVHPPVPSPAVPQSGALPLPVNPASGFGKPVGAPATTIGNVQAAWQAQQGANQNAQTVISYLQSMKGLAQQASTGLFSDKLLFTNSLLSRVGAPQATDAVTATNLLDKYGNQITAMLGGSGGMSTDAGRSILQSAYPNKHMDAAAINDAADTLIGAQRSVQARTQVLQSYGQTGDPNYNVVANRYDTLQDPRIFRWKEMPPGAAKEAYKAQILASDPTIAARAKALQAMGVQ